MNFLELKSGTSVEGQEIKAFKAEEKGAKCIYLIAGVHGDEVEGVFVLKQLFSWLQETDDHTIPLLVIPTLNIDGHRCGARVNAHGVDLNRNLPSDNWSNDFKEQKYNPGNKPLSEPENQFLVNLFDKYPPLFIISFHTWKPLLNYNGDCIDIANFLSRHNNYSVEGDVGYETPGSLGEYAPKKYNSPVLTYELPKIDTGLSLNDIWLQNHFGLKKLFGAKIFKDLFENK